MAGGGGAAARVDDDDPNGAKEKPDKELEARQRRGRVILGLHLAVLVAAATLLIGWGGLNPGPEGTGPECARVHDDHDKLLDLAGRRTEAAADAQLQRWDACDRRFRDTARDAVARDYGLVVTIAVGLGMAVLLTHRRPGRRFLLAARIAAGFGLVYVVADIGENLLLAELLKDDTWRPALPWLAAVKVGAFLAALPIFLTSLALAVGEARAKPRKETPAGKSSEGDRSTVDATGRSSGKGYTTAGDRFKKRMSFSPAEQAASATEAAPSSTSAGLGVACSGGGVRSAAFTLGALQALQTPPNGGTKDDSELARAEVVTAVSGGAYMAAAWYTGRKGNDEAWIRRSPEEQHLRRHASYMAPGLTGKLWALARFLLGLTLNLAVFVLALGALFIPYGVAINAFALEPEPLPGGATVTLPAGGCLETVNGASSPAPAPPCSCGAAPPSPWTRAPPRWIRRPRARRHR